MRKIISAIALLLAMASCTSAPSSDENEAAQPGWNTSTHDPLRPSDPVNGYTQDLRGNPAFDDCVDERNKHNLRKTYGDLDNLIPCWNSFLHIKVDEKAVPGFVGGNIPDAVNERMWLRDSGKTPEPENVWRFTVLLRDDNKSFQVGYGWPDAIEQWEIYYKKSDDPWQIAGNLNDYSFPVGGQLEVIFVAHNPALPADDAEVSDKLPFAWDQVAKDWYVPHFE